MGLRSSLPTGPRDLAGARYARLLSHFGFFGCLLVILGLRSVRNAKHYTERSVVWWQAKRAPQLHEERQRKLNSIITIEMTNIVINGLSYRDVDFGVYYNFSCKIEGTHDAFSYGCIVKSDKSRVYALKKIIKRIRDDFYPKQLSFKINVLGISSYPTEVDHTIYTELGRRYIKSVYKCSEDWDNFTIITPCTISVDIEYWKEIYKMKVDEMRHIQLKYLFENPSHGFEELEGCGFCYENRY